MKNLSPGEVAYLATSIAVELAKDQSVDDINLMRNIASQIACSFSTILSQRICIEKFLDKKNK